MKNWHMAEMFKKLRDHSWQPTEWREVSILVRDPLGRLIAGIEKASWWSPVFPATECQAVGNIRDAIWRSMDGQI